MKVELFCTWQPLKTYKLRIRRCHKQQLLSTLWHRGQPNGPQNESTINPDVFTEENLFSLPSLIERKVVEATFMGSMLLLSH